MGIRGNRCRAVKTALDMNATDEDESHGILEGEEAPPFDLIKCGECNADFALADIVKFIDHKRKCYPRPVVVDPMQLMVSAEPDQDIVDLSLVKTKTAEEGRKREEPAQEEEEEEGEAVAIAEVAVRSKKPKIITPIKRISSTSSMQRDPISPRVKQTQTQTSEPDQCKTYICYSCKDLFDNAASLLEHVQSDHGMQIYQQPWKARDTGSSSTLSESSSHGSAEAKMSRKTYSPLSPDTGSDVKPVMPTVSTTPSSLTSGPPPPQPTLPHAIPMLPVSSVAALPAHHHSPLLVHSPHTRHSVHPLEGSPLSVYMHPSPSEQHMLPAIGERIYPQCVALRDVLGTTDRASLNNQMLMPPHGFDPGSHAPFSSTGRAIDMDLYSQRLRELAAAGPQNPPKKKGYHYQFLSPRFKSPFSPKVKACEFCGKTFKFQSNLIVHRRSHTGEKPYKCQLCDHACSQASKLKRHMKTHTNKPPSTVTSPSSELNMSDDAVTGETSASSLIKTAVDRYMSESKFSSKDTSIDDDENEEEEEEEEEEVEEYEGEEEEEEEMEEVSSDEANVGERSSDTDGLRQSSNRGDNHDEKENHSSLLSQVMKHTGLSEIQQYSEAYQQAVAERYHSHRSSSRLEEHASLERYLKEHRSGEGGLLREVLAGPSYCSPEKEHSRSPTRSPRNAMSGLEEVTKRIKVEPSTTAWVPDPSSFPSKDPFSRSPVLQSSQSSPSVSATNGTVPGYYSAGDSTDRPPHSSPSSSSMSYSSLALHKSTKQLAIDRRTGTCEFCGKVFKNCSNLTVHRRSHTGEKPYKCALCPYACAQSSKLTRHMKTHGHGAKEVFKCEVCGMPFSVYSTLEKHMKKNHWGNIRGTTR